MTPLQRDLEALIKRIGNSDVWSSHDGTLTVNKPNREFVFEWDNQVTNGSWVYEKGRVAAVTISRSVELDRLMEILNYTLKCEHI